MRSNAGNKPRKASRKADHNNERRGSGSGKEGYKKPEGGGNWKNKPKQSMKKFNGIKTAMLVLAEEEKTNKYLIAAF